MGRLVNIDNLFNEIVKSYPEMYKSVAMATKKLDEGVVRCRDCKYRSGDYCADKDGFARYSRFFVHMDDYCSNGVIEDSGDSAR